MVPQAHPEPRPASLARHAHRRPRTTNQSSTMDCSATRTSEHPIRSVGVEDQAALHIIQHPVPCGSKNSGVPHAPSKALGPHAFAPCHVKRWAPQSLISIRMP